MPKPQAISLGRGIEIPILYEDRSVLAIDKPAGWLLVPSDWDRTARNLQLAITSSIRAGDFWARARNLKFLRFVHRLDADTTGVLLFAKSPGSVSAYSRMFEERAVIKKYYAVVEGTPPSTHWTAKAAIGPDPFRADRMKVDQNQGKPAETQFSVEQRGTRTTLISAMPVTGRTHQIRVHLLDSGLQVIGDSLYGSSQNKSSVAEFPLALRSALLQYADAFTRRKVIVTAPMDRFIGAFGFASR
jgi:RluA family pseudouridine synthase